MNEYNGYKNYNTWNIVLWMHNDEEAYQALSRQAAIRKDIGTKWEPQTAKQTVTVILKSRFGKAETPDEVKVSRKDIDWKQVSDALNENI